MVKEIKNGYKGTKKEIKSFGKWGNSKEMRLRLLI